MNDTPSPSPRTIAIGDIHGCTAALDALLDAIRPTAADTIVALGDYVDRGPDTRETIDRLIELGRRCRLVPLLGNHDQLLLSVCGGRRELIAEWLRFGGDATLRSYGDTIPLGVPPDDVPGSIQRALAARPELVPQAHLDFLAACRLFWETPTQLFVHGSYDPRLPLAEQSPGVLLWQSLKAGVPGPHSSGKRAIVGHTSQKSGEILDLGHLVCIDTRCYADGWLTAMDVDTGELWQADKAGRLRDRRLT